MNTIRPCGCKGVRTCLECEKAYAIKKTSLTLKLHDLEAWSYCAKCNKIYPGWDTFQVNNAHPQHDNHNGRDFPGCVVQENFLTIEEGAILLQNLDALPWVISQSGRRKQNFGPKTNFKKRKLQAGQFEGFPEFSKFVQQRLCENVLLNDFQTIEQCSLEYDPLKGSCIDPHIDDCWIWGERIVTVNCLGDTILTMTLYDTNLWPKSKYNLNIVNEYEDKLLMPLFGEEELQWFKNRVIRIPMPNLSLIVLYGPPRFQFEHAVLREDVLQRRVCIAYREFTKMYIDGELKQNGDVIRERAKKFWQK